MANKIEGYIGCPACHTVLARIESAQGTNPGVFANSTVPLVEGETVGSNCPNEGCGAVLVRVPGPVE
jgi:hypothetical protein